MKHPFPGAIYELGEKNCALLLICWILLDAAGEQEARRTSRHPQIASWLVWVLLVPCCYQERSGPSPELYGVETRVLVQAVKRNLPRFAEGFMFQLSGEEFQT